MNRRYRLTNSSDFQRVRRTGTSFAHPLAVLIVSPGNVAETRFGFTAARSLGNAVRRNRAKRLLRVVGDGATLATHDFYRRWIEYFESLDAYHTVWELQ